MISETLVKQFLIFLYRQHVEEYGESISKLPDAGFHVLENVFVDEHPEAVVALNDDTYKKLTFNLAKELNVRGFAEVDALVVTLTPNGYEEARRLSHPAKYFLHNHLHKP